MITIEGNIRDASFLEIAEYCETLCGEDADITLRAAGLGQVYEQQGKDLQGLPGQEDCLSRLLRGLQEENK